MLAFFSKGDLLCINLVLLAWEIRRVLCPGFVESGFIPGEQVCAYDFK